MNRPGPALPRSLRRRVAVVLAVTFAGGAACVSSPEPRSAPAGPSSSIVGTSTSLLITLAPEDAVVTGLIEADSLRVWSALPDVYRGLGLGGSVMDPAGRVYGNPRFSGARIGGDRPDRFVRCAGTSGGLSGVGNYRIRLSIASRVQGQIDGRSLLTTMVSGHATTVEGTSTAPSRCVSNGRLEQLIAERTAEATARR
jgi:hypothetical protein